jgi:hypothetical protein
MKEIVYKIGSPKDFSESEKKSFLDLLKEQGKVASPTIEKIERCFLLCFCKVDNVVVSIGAVKPKTNSDFNPDKADLENLRNDFHKELGYCFTLTKHTGNGYSSPLVKLLLDKVAHENLMASTELRSDNSMVRILERNGLKQYGRPWKSRIHNGVLGLFLKYIK